MQPQQISMSNPTTLAVKNLGAVGGGWVQRNAKEDGKPNGTNASSTFPAAAFGRAKTWPVYRQLPTTIIDGLPPPFPSTGRTLGRDLWAASSLLLKVLLLLFLSLLLLTGISLFFSWLFPAQRLMQPATASKDEWLLEEFTNFQRKFAKAYHSDQERLERFRLFVQNLWQLEERRQLDRRLGVEGRTQWGVTQFFDWSDQEMAQLLLAPGHPSLSEQLGTWIQPVEQFRPTTPGYRRPKEWDWRKKGVVNHVKNQLRCGSCWAFAVAATVESQHAIHNGTLVSLSEQQMIDCDLAENGCEGGYRPNAFRYVRDNGLVLDSVYPYRGNDGRCLLPPGPADPSQRVFVDELKSLPSDEGQIADWIVEKGPVSFGMNVTKSMYQYSGGVFAPTSQECAQTSMGTHAMEVVGFGETEQGLPYWILKNSWGSGYGVNGGYLLMTRGENACGLAREVHTALITKP